MNLNASQMMAIIREPIRDANIWLTVFESRNETNQIESNPFPSPGNDIRLGLFPLGCYIFYPDILYFVSLYVYFGFLFSGIRVRIATAFQAV